MRIPYAKGNYAFLRGISPYSAGAIAQAGYEIEHARLLRPVPLGTGFQAIQAHLRKLGRPVQALCGIELRSPKPFSFHGFNEFNATYIAMLNQWQIPENGLNPVARTNVAPVVGPPLEPALYGFSYTVPSADAPPSFVIAGAGELPEGSLDPHDVVRRGETSPDALLEKARFVMELMEGRLKGLGVGWAQATASSVYTAHNLHLLIERTLLHRMGEAAQHGVIWHYARPPIESIEFEMDVRGCRREVVL